MNVKRNYELILLLFIFFITNISFCDEKLSLPEGWYNRGWLIDTNVEIFKSPKTDEVIGNTGSKESELFFCETFDAGEKYKWLKIRTTVLDEKKGEFVGVEGWINGKYVQLNEYGNLFADGVLGAIKVMEDMPYFLGFNNADFGKKTILKQSEELELGVLTWAEGFSCFYTENTVETLNQKPNKEGWGLVPVSFRITSDKFAFLGLTVGMESKKIKEFDSNLTKAGWKSVSVINDFIVDSTYIWQKKGREIIIEIVEGKIFAISQSQIL